MLKKIKRLIPKFVLEFRKKENISSTTDKNSESKAVTNYQYLCNDPIYTDANVITKIWYLRGRFDWFDHVARQSKITADTSIELLNEIMMELDNIAYSMPNMYDACSFLNIKNNVMAYYLQYNGELDKDTDYFHAQVEYQSPVYEQIWCLRYMFDCAYASNSKQIYQDVCNWLKTLQFSAEEDEAKAIKKILKDVQREKRKNVFMNFRK